MKNIPLKAIRRGTPSVRAYVQAVEKGWHATPVRRDQRVATSGAQLVTKIFSTQNEAVEYARQIALQQQTELFIHGRDGRIRERNSYGRDSFPPRG